MHFMTNSGIPRYIRRERECLLEGDACGEQAETNSRNFLSRCSRELIKAQFAYMKVSEFQYGNVISTQSSILSKKEIVRTLGYTT